jgi:hypothetical protein
MGSSYTSNTSDALQKLSLLKKSASANYMPETVGGSSSSSGGRVRGGGVMKSSSLTLPPASPNVSMAQFPTDAEGIYS